MDESSRPVNVSAWALIVSIVGVAASIAAIVGLPYQMGLVRSASVAGPAAPVAASISTGAAPPPPQEVVAWNSALANPGDCDALRSYLLEYPTGRFARAAQTLLSARREITDEQWAPFEFPNTVAASSSLEGRESRDAACASARQQLLVNMTEGCGVYRHQPSRYRSVQVAPPGNPICDCQDEAIRFDGQPASALWRCSIHATYSCRGDQLRSVKRFVCN